MTDVSRPRLLLSGKWPTAELRRAGFEGLDESHDCQMLLWEDLSDELLENLASMESRVPRLEMTGRSALLCGNTQDFGRLGDALMGAGLEAAGGLLREVVEAPEKERCVRIAGGRMDFDRIAIVGILNVTRDSFYDGGRYFTLDAALERAEQLEEAGADVIEVGGEKAGPGALVSEADEIRRVIPVIEGIRERSDIVLSVDTFKPGVARRAIEVGAEIVNDIDGMRNHAMREAVAPSSAAVVIMHILGRPRVHQPCPQYGSVIGDVTQSLHRQIEICEDSGIDRDRVIIDPGPGFGKTTEQDISLLRRLPELRGFPQPLMLAISRKPFIGEALDLRDPHDRLAASLAMTAYAVASSGVDLVRTHDVAETKRVIDVLEKLTSCPTGE